MKNSLAVCVSVFWVFGNFFSFPSGAAYGEEKKLTIGSISSTPAAEIARFEPVARYVSDRLKPLGAFEGKVVVTASMREMAEQIKAGKVDFYIDSPFPILKVCQISGAKPFLRRWKKGSGTNYSVIFTRTDSGIQKLEDLKGKMIALDEPFSTTGCLIPKAVLRGLGLTLSEKRSFKATVGADEVGYVFATSEENIVFWVLKGLVAAGATKREDMEELSGENLDKLKVLYKSMALPKHLICHRADLDPQILAAVEKILLEMDKDEEGKRVLGKFQNTVKFDKITDEIRSCLQKLEDMMEHLGKELED